MSVRTIAPPAAGAVLGPFAANQPALGVERVAVGAAAVLAKRRHRRPLLSIFKMRLPWMSLKKTLPVGIDGRAFEKADAGGDGDFRFRGEERGGERSFGEIGHFGGTR